METSAPQAYVLAFQADRAVNVRVLERVLGQLSPPVRGVQVRGPTVLVGLPLDPQVDPRVEAAALRRDVAASVGDPGLSVGIGGPRDRERSVRLVALQAEQAVRLGRALGGHGRITAFSDLGPYCFVLGRPTAEIEGFCKAVLGPLAERAQRDELRTLEEFLRAHGSVNAVARALFLHRNTVRQRLKRIGELTGADLNDAGSRVHLYLAVLGHKALKELAS